MAINLTSVVTQFLTPEVITQIASFLGLDQNATKKAAAASVPALLAGLSDLVANPAGTSQLSKLLSSQPAGTLMDLLRKGDAQGLAQAGSNMLPGLFGGGVGANRVRPAGDLHEQIQVLDCGRRPFGCVAAAGRAGFGHNAHSGRDS